MRSRGCRVYAPGPQDTWPGARGTHTHQGLEVLAVVAGVGRGERPQRRVPPVALQGRGEQAAPQVRRQRVARRRLPDGRPACGLHPGWRRAACGETRRLRGEGGACGQRGAGPATKGQRGWGRQAWGGARRDGRGENVRTSVSHGGPGRALAAGEAAGGGGTGQGPRVSAAGAGKGWR